MNTSRAVVGCLLALAFVGNSFAVDGVRELFNGKDLTGWKGNLDLWSVKDGCITGTIGDKPIKSNTFLIWKDGEVGDFELDADYKMVGNNSGIQYRSKILNAEGFVVGGYQADIDDSLQFSGINYEEKGRGILAQRGQRLTIAKNGDKQVESFGTAEELAKSIKNRDWNHYRIVAKGNTVSHYINDKLMSEVIDDQDNEKAKAARRGVLALQIHTGPPMVIQFKNIRLKDLSSAAK